MTYVEGGLAAATAAHFPSRRMHPGSRGQAGLRGKEGGVTVRQLKLSRTDSQWLRGPGEEKPHGHAIVTYPAESAEGLSSPLDEERKK